MKLRCIEDHCGYLTVGKIYECIGKICDCYTIKDDEGDEILVRTDYSTHGKFEEVKEMTKSDLVPGEHVVEYRNGSKRYFTGNVFVDRNDSWNPVKEYKEDLKDKDDKTCFDIMAIYKVQYPSCIEYMIKNAEEIWRRDETSDEHTKLMEQIEELKAKTAELEEQAEKLKG